jgi:uncharacterized protein (DUF427 family)
MRSKKNLRGLPITPDQVKQGQESVWDYPRPPIWEKVSKRVVVTFGGRVIVDTTDAIRVLETSHPPAYYLPISHFVPGVLVPAEGSTFCEFKGRASYFDVVSGDDVAVKAAWSYPDPARGFGVLADRVSLYPGRMDRCEIDGEVVVAQEGDFYGGWITSNIVGPYKGAPGTWGW